MRMKPKTGLLIITEDSPESYSPAGERVRHMALASCSFFGKVIVLASRGTNRQSGRGVTSKALLYEVSLAVRMPFPISAYFDPLKLLMFVAMGFRLLKRYKPRFVLASMPPLEVGVSAWFLAKLSHVELIIDLRDDWESSVGSQITRYISMELVKPLFMLANKIYSFSIGIFAVTKTIANTIRRRGVNTPIFLVPNGADTSVFLSQSERVRSETRLKYALPQDKIVITYCGSGINPYYRLDRILLSVKALPNEVKKRIFLIFFLYNGVKGLTRLRLRLGVSEDLVEIRGPLHRSNLAEVLAACDMGLVPFDEKPYLLCARSTKLYEYLSTGLYVISSGPRGGELDSFFSNNPYLGLFTRPSVEDFVHVLSQVVKESGRLFGDDYRRLRRSFIMENYDRRKTMMGAIKKISVDADN